MNETNRQDRIAAAWEKAGDIVTKWDGMLTEAFLGAVEPVRAAESLRAILADAQDVSVPWFLPGEANVEQEEIDSPAKLIPMFVTDPFAEAMVVLTRPVADFEFRHQITFQCTNGMYEVRVAWWPDWAFEGAASAKARFAIIVGYLFDLQELVGARELHVAEETMSTPESRPEDWVQI